MARREFLQLAKKFTQGKDSPSGMWISEKLDGTRVFWDGGVSRGLPTITVPWANTINPKTGELKAKIKPKATGLWSRYGNPIIAPDWWLNQLPSMFLDGELFAGRGNFQTLRSIVAKDVADSDAWKDVQFAAFGSPSPAQVFAAGEIKNPNFHLDIKPEFVLGWLNQRVSAGVMEEFTYTPNAQTFEDEINMMQGALTGDLCYLHQHVKLPDDPSEAEDKMNGFMDFVLSEGGEGVMLRKSNSIWTPKRVSNLLKLKPYTDDQGTITGFVSGRKTALGSKLLGLIGAVILDYNGKRLELAGFTVPEREFATPDATRYAVAHPGEDMPSGFGGRHFKVGDTIEFRYRELSDAGIPKEARFLRHV
jgi:DNA ligase-1